MALPSYYLYVPARRNIEAQLRDIEEEEAALPLGSSYQPLDYESMLDSLKERRYAPANQ